MIKQYYSLTKPGIIYGNGLNTIAGFFLASQGQYNWAILGTTLIGMSFIVASACVFNNILDAKIDAQMERTKSRAMVTGTISKSSAVLFGALLLILGTLVLFLFSNLYSLFAGILGFLIYVFAYTFFKRHTLWATEIGSVSGAMPPLAGYLAMSNEIDAGAIILFLTFVFWQMPHFYAIAVYRLKEYQAAGIPVLPAIKGILRTKINTLIYILAFIVALSALTFYGYAGYLYLAVMGLLSFYWLWMVAQGLRTTDDRVWAKKIFKFSLIMVLIFCVIIPIDNLLR